MTYLIRKSIAPKCRHYFLLITAPQQRTTHDRTITHCSRKKPNNANVLVLSVAAWRGTVCARSEAMFSCACICVSVHASASQMSNLASKRRQNSGDFTHPDRREETYKWASKSGFDTIGYLCLFILLDTRLPFVLWMDGIDTIPSQLLHGWSMQ